MALKQDDDFLRYLTMGAAGTGAVIHDLKERHGHRAVELERYATANKLWTTKIKRLRLPDLFCLDCGIRVEVRVKSDLAIRMSHSDSPERQWDTGLRDRDLAAFIAWNRETEAASASPQFFEIGAMRAVASHAKLGPRKSASEGAERDLTWLARVPKRDGTVEVVDIHRGSITYRPNVGRRNTYSLPAGIPVHFYADEDQALRGEEEFLLGSVAPPGSVACSDARWDWSSDLNSESKIDMYAAIKAAGLHGAQAVENRLLNIADDPDEDERIRLEARGSLARIDPDRHVPRLALDAGRPTEGDAAQMAIAMESIFILSELPCDAAGEALIALANDRRVDSEARCAAVWGLGAAGLDEARSLLPFIADGDDEVALHALAAIGEIDNDGFATLTRMLSGTDREAASASVLLAEDGETGLSRLLDTATRDDRSSLWARAALGEIPREDLLDVAGTALSAELEAVLQPMWIARESWLQSQSAESPLDFLRRQRIRYLP